MKDEIVVPRFETWIRNNPHGPYNEWTEREILVLKKYWGKIPGRDIAKELGRTYKAVKWKAAEMGIRARD